MDHTSTAMRMPPVDPGWRALGPAEHTEVLHHGYRLLGSSDLHAVGIARTHL